MVTGMMRETFSHAGLSWKASVDSGNTYIEGEENVKKLGIAEKFKINVYMYILTF